MKYIKNYEYFKLYESNDIQIKNEKLLVKLLLKSRDFSKGEILYGLTDVVYDHMRDYGMNIDDGLKWAEDTFGDLPVFAVYLTNYNGQVGNGGHQQYFDNGYASEEHRGFGKEYKDIKKHENFVRLFTELNFDEVLPLGNKAFNIISSFELPEEDDSGGMVECPECDRGTVECSACDGEERIDCPECDGSGESEDGSECPHCHGRGNFECDQCDGTGREDCRYCDGEGRVENDGSGYRNINSDWEELDERWYKISEDLMDQIDEYLKNLTLDGEKISELVKIATAEQKFNM